MRVDHARSACRVIDASHRGVPKPRWSPEAVWRCRARRRRNRPPVVGSGLLRDAFAGFRRRATRENQVRAGLMTGSALAAALCTLVIASPAEAAPMHGFSDDPRAFEQNGSEALAAGATGNRVVVGWRQQPSDLAPAVAAMGGATPIISLNTIRAPSSAHRFATANRASPHGRTGGSRRPWRRSTPARMPSTPSIPHRSCSARRLRR